MRRWRPLKCKYFQVGKGSDAVGPLKPTHPNDCRPSPDNNCQSPNHGWGFSRFQAKGGAHHDKDWESFATLRDQH